MDLIPGDALAIATIRAEADGEPYEGKLAVASVIRNRMRFCYQSDGTAAGTVFHPYAFSCWNTPMKTRAHWLQVQVEDPRTQEARMAWEASEKVSNVGDAVLYFNPRGVSHEPEWVKATTLVKRISHHLFYFDPATKKGA